MSKDKQPPEESTADPVKPNTETWQDLPPAEQPGALLAIGLDELNKQYAAGGMSLDQYKAGDKALRDAYRKAVSGRRVMGKADKPPTSPKPETLNP